MPIPSSRGSYSNIFQDDTTVIARIDNEPQKYPMICNADKLNDAQFPTRSSI
jgi:hypothetical protein